MAEKNRISRIADALRANLRRRKQQARDRKSGDAADASVVWVAGAGATPRNHGADERGPDDGGSSSGGGDGGGGGD